MPVYEFCCERCQHTFESQHRIADAPKELPCPLCGVDAARILSACGFSLQGSGWAADGYATPHFKDK